MPEPRYGARQCQYSRTILALPLFADPAAFFLSAFPFPGEMARGGHYSRLACPRAASRPHRLPSVRSCTWGAAAYTAATVGRPRAATVVLHDGTAPVRTVRRRMQHSTRITSPPIIVQHTCAQHSIDVCFQSGGVPNVILHNLHATYGITGVRQKECSGTNRRLLPEATAGMAYTYGYRQVVAPLGHYCRHGI